MLCNVFIDHVYDVFFLKTKPIMLSCHLLVFCLFSDLACIEIKQKNRNFVSYHHVCQNAHCELLCQGCVNLVLVTVNWSTLKRLQFLTRFSTKILVIRLANGGWAGGRAVS